MEVSAYCALLYNLKFYHSVIIFASSQVLVQPACGKFASFALYLISRQRRDINQSPSISDGIFQRRGVYCSKRELVPK